MTLIPQDFVSKWKRAEARERQSVQEHFIDLCSLVGHETPMQADPRGKRYAFEMGAARTSGEHGWADVAKLGYFGWEYKGKHADLDKAYDQLLRYRDALQNPPLLIVSDIEQKAVFAILQLPPLKPSPSRGRRAKSRRMIRACRPSLKPRKNWWSSAIAG